MSEGPPGTDFGRFRAYYAVAVAPVVREMERTVLGADYGGNSYTTVEQALELASLLGLGPGVDLLEIGAGAGWPGLFLARETGCRVTFTDVPHEGLAAARARAAAESIAGCRFVAADGARLPFRAASFAAASHSDVMC